MALYSYIKATRRTRIKKYTSVVSISCIFSGLSLLTWVMYPILVFELAYAPRFSELIQPVPTYASESNIVADISSVLGSTTTDYTKASVWFPRAVTIKLAANTVSYTLSIPKFKIDHANVMTGTEDLDRSLIHFTGPMPGMYGNPVIFGHSSLPFLYNPANYKTIFTKLPDLKRGDDIFVDVDKVKYRYQVTDMHVVMPDDLSVLDQRYDGNYITLVTCVPPGTYLRRLVVRGSLVPN